MNEKLVSLLKEQLEKDKEMSIKIDAGTMPIEELGYNPKMLRDEITLLNQILYIQDVKSEILKNMANKENV